MNNSANEELEQAGPPAPVSDAKPYDLNELGRILLEEAGKDGIHLAEEALQALGKAVYVGAKRWITESAAKSDNKIDDLIAGFFGYADSWVMPQIEKLHLGKKPE